MHLAAQQPRPQQVQAPGPQTAVGVVAGNQFGNRGSGMGSRRSFTEQQQQQLQHGTSREHATTDQPAVVVMRDQFGSRNTGLNPTSLACVFNTIPSSITIPLHACHPHLSEEQSTVIILGTAFQLVMGIPSQKVVCGVYFSPSEWYIDGLTRPRVISSDETSLDLRKYPGSHIPETRTNQALWATMALTRIEDEKVFNMMVRKMDSRIIQEIHRRASPMVSVSQVQAQFFDLGSEKYTCDICRRGFTSAKGFDRHACSPGHRYRHRSS